jgi:hypothetical protein
MNLHGREKMIDSLFGNWIAILLAYFTLVTLFM